MLFPFFKESLSSLHLGLINSGIRNTFPMHLSFKVFPRQKSKIAEKMALLCDIVRVIPSRGLYAFFMIYCVPDSCHSAWLTVDNQKIFIKGMNQ